MSVSSGRRHKQAIQVLNTIDYNSNGNPIGLKEDNTNPLSANFGTEREPLRGGCYKGDGSTSYVNISDSASLIQFIPETMVFTISFWGKVNDITAETANTFIGNKVTSSYNGFSIFHDNRSIYGRNESLFIWIGEGTIFTKLEFNNFITDTDWHYYFITGDGSTIQLHFDNEYKGGTPVIGLVTTEVIHNLRLLGGQIGSGGSIATTWNGTNSIFDVRIFDEYIAINEDLNKYQPILKLNCSEHSGDICYDSSGNGNHGDIINAITTTPEENPNSIHQYQDIYSFENENGYNKSVDVYIPKDFSIISPPFKDVLGYNLQYQGKVPGKAKFVQSNCFYGDGVGYIDGGTNVPNPSTCIVSYEYGVYVQKNENPLTASGIFGVSRSGTYYARYSLYMDSSGLIYIINFGQEIGYSTGYILDKNPHELVVKYLAFDRNIYFYVDGELIYQFEDAIVERDLTGFHLWIGTYGNAAGTEPVPGLEFLGKIYNCYIKIDDGLVYQLPLCESIINPSSHTYYDISGNGNHATLVNGTDANEGKQDEFHCSQNGCIIRGDGTMIPILEDKTEFADGSLLADVDAILQDDKSFLNTGTKLQPYDYPALKQADKDNDFWYDIEGDQRQIEFGKFKTENPINSKYYFGKDQYSTDEDITGLTNITTYLNPLNSKQVNTEKIVRNVFEITSNWLLKTGQWDDSGVWEDSAYFDIKD
jgi:hypothetical protein